MKAGTPCVTKATAKHLDGSPHSRRLRGCGERRRECDELGADAQHGGPDHHVNDHRPPIYRKAQEIGLESERVVLTEGVARGDPLVDAELRQRRHERADDVLERGVICVFQ